ncbi:dimethylsulfonioproprionate lyase family protein [Gibbsiella quercinecans]|uniref:dimethylsulfonioproprionate lyase family protein n=1 Tax=Gibbsiella quercinecans TaxID=929813 RepID=UPI0022A862D9|nr:dimethylsulfonioproprionate lyase family protein [Gibbsiella quercinecans]
MCSMLRSLLPSLSWFFGHRRHPDFPHLEDNVAFAQFVGPEDLWRSARLAIGLTLIAPETLYPAHSHPATEIYLPLAGTGLWSMGNSDYHPRKPGELIFHRSHVPHTTLAQKDPILALYVWYGDIGLPSEWQYG